MKAPELIFIGLDGAVDSFFAKEADEDTIFMIVPANEYKSTVDKIITALQDHSGFCKLQ